VRATLGHLRAIGARSLLVAIVAASSACSGDPGADGRSMVLRTTSVASGEHCANGGIMVETGVDDNGNVLLDGAEVDFTVFVCDGADGKACRRRWRNPGRTVPWAA